VVKGHSSKCRAFLLIYLATYLTVFHLARLALCLSVSLHLSDSVWPHVSQSTTVSVGINRQTAWQPALLTGLLRWQLCSFRTISKITHCWHFLHTHSHRLFLLTHFPFIISWERFFSRKMLVCVLWGVLFSTSWELLHDIYTYWYLSQDMFKCHNTSTSTGNGKYEQQCRICKAFFWIAVWLLPFFRSSLSPSNRLSTYGHIFLEVAYSYVRAGV